MKGMLYLHRMKAIRHWLDHQTPDMSYGLNTYACKIMGSTIRNECLVAKHFPDERAAALLMARHVAAYLRSVSQPEGSPLAYFPPTYINGLVGNADQEINNTTMCMEAVTVAEGLLDLYDETHDRQYLDWVLGIADTYQRLQRPDGSLPIKLVVRTGEPVNDRCAMLHPLLFFLRRLHDSYGLDKYTEMQRAGEEWMHSVAIKNFDMTGQFEDVSVLNLKPYENLTNCTAAPYADYLCSKAHLTAEELQDAEDLLRLSEDQFVHWEMHPMPDGLPPHVLPCVFEQYKFQQSVDSSVCDVAGGFLAHYCATGSQLSLAKALSLTNSITVAQDARSGFLPTIWERTAGLTAENMWLNCALHSIQHLLRMAEVGE
jgi:maltose/maltodextrin transport system substrate-binding protein